MQFDGTDAMARLDNLADAEFDALPFGVVRMRPDGTVAFYNRFESEAAGLRPALVLDRHFFEEVAPCANNALVAQRFADEPELDATIPYVFTLRMRPTAVRLRLLRSARSAWWYLLVERPA